MNYFIIENGAQQGPFSVNELQMKGISSETLVWTEGMTDWTPAWQIDELRAIVNSQTAGTPPPPPPSQSDGATGNMQTPPPAGPQQPGGPAAPNGNTNRPGRHRVAWCIIGVLVVIAALFAFTNPSEEAHKQALLSHVTNGISNAVADDNSDDDNNPIAQALTSIGSAFAGNMIEMVLNETLEYHNYLLYSTTSVHIGKHDVRTSVGCLGKVYTVDEDQLTQSLKKSIPTLGDSDDADDGASTSSDTDADQDVQVQRTEKDTTLVDEAGRAIGRAVVKQVTKTVKKKVSESTDSTTSNSIGRIIDEIEKLVGAN